MRTAFYALITVMVLTACSHNLREELDESLNKYNNLVRWNSIESASVFASDAIRPDFIARAQATKGIKIIDCRIVNARYDEEKRKASVEVEIEYYALASARVKTLRDTEEWVYKEEKGIKGWRLVSLVPEFK